MDAGQRQGFWWEVAEDMRAHGILRTGWPSVIKSIGFHPGIRILFRYRLQLRFRDKSAPLRLLAKALRARNHREGCDISPWALLEPGVVLPHPIGIVIGHAAIVRAGSKIFQNCSLGVYRDGDYGAPVVEEGAILYSGVVAIGAITIGRNAVVAANAVVRSDVPAGALAAGVPAVIKRYAQDDADRPDEITSSAFS